MIQLKMKGICSVLLWFLLSLAFSIPTVLADDADPKAILFLGNSLTAGYGVEPSQAFPALIEQRIDALGWNFRVINAGQSGDTTAGGVRRLDWLLRRKIHILVLELGINDGLRGLPVKLIRQNLQTIMDQTKGKYPEVEIVLAGMQAPPNLGQDYSSRFTAIYPELAKRNGVRLIPFLLEGVGGNPELNLHDGIHPSGEGYKIVAENVWKVLEPMLRSMK